MLALRENDCRCDTETNRTKFTYDAQGRVETVTDARSNVTTFGWDNRGRLLSVTNALTPSESTHFTYSGPNAAPVDPTMAPPGEFLTGIEIGRTVAEGEGQVRRFRVDPRGRVGAVERKDDSGTFVQFAEFEYDSDGNRTRSEDATLRTVTFGYDLLRRLTTVTDAAANTTTFAYDAVGNRTSVEDAAQRDTLFVYDDLDRLTEVRQEALSPVLVTQFGYDAAGNVTSVGDPKGQTTTYGYDPLSRLTDVTQELGQTVSYGYDAAGRLDTVTNARGQVLDYSYFPWGALEAVAHVGASPPRTVSYTYDLAGNLETVSDSGLGLASPLLYTFAYDALNRVDTATAHYLPGGDRGLASDYDRFGNRSGLTHTGDGSALVHVWRHDDLDRLFQAVLPGGADPTLELAYYANDELQTLTHRTPAGTVRATTDYTYHPHGPIQTITVADSMPAQLLELTYTPDALLNVDALTEQHGPSDPTEPYDYEYDEVSRLKLADYPAAFDLPADEGFAYDDAGNREDPVDPALYDYDANNRIATSPGRGYQFDPDGNLTQIDDGQPTPTTLATLGWDFTSRLRSYDNLVTGETASYLYDPFGRRIRKVVDDGVTAITTFSLWDGDQLLAEYDGSGSRTVRYAYAGGFAPVEVAYPDGGGGEDVYAVHTDHLDTPRLLTDAAGAPVWRAAYEAFGRAHVDPDPDGDANEVTFNIRFPGQHYDAETELAGEGSGLHYNLHRTYDPAIGRYVSADPIGQFGLLASHRVDSPVIATPVFISNPTNLLLDNGYLYAFANPVGFVDHRGEVAHIVGGVAGGALVGGVVGSAVSVARAFAIQSAQGNIRSGQLIGAATTGFGIGAVAGGVAGGALASGQFGIFVPAAQQVGVGSGTLFRLGFSAAIQSPRVPGFLGALAGGLFSSPEPANGAQSANSCTNPPSGPPGGDDLHGQFLGGFGALSRQ